MLQKEIFTGKIAVLIYGISMASAASYFIIDNMYKERINVFGHENKTYLKEIRDLKNENSTYSEQIKLIQESQDIIAVNTLIKTNSEMQRRNNDLIKENKDLQSAIKKMENQLLVYEEAKERVTKQSELEGVKYFYQGKEITPLLQQIAFLLDESWADGTHEALAKEYRNIIQKLKAEIKEDETIQKLSSVDTSPSIFSTDFRDEQQRNIRQEIEQHLSIIFNYLQKYGKGT